MSWKDKTCEGCLYRTGDVCSKSPVRVGIMTYKEKPSSLGVMYPNTLVADGFKPACAEYAELIEPPKATEG